MNHTPRWLASTLAILTGVALAGGCGDSKPSGVNEDGTRGVSQTGGKCAVDGAVSACTIEIGRHEGIISCAKGTRVCRGGSWGACAAETTTTARYKVAAPPVSVSGSAGSGKIRGLSISPTGVDCTDNPCDPYCKNFPDIPDAALTGDSAITYPDRNLTFDELTGGNPPDGFVKKGNDDQAVCGSATCYPAGTPGTPANAVQACMEACQFDSHCTGNGTNGCTMFTDGQKNSCTGIDITTPLVCQIPDGATDGGFRKLSVCNRGSADVPINSNIVCWKFPGGQPQYPNGNPLDSATNSAGPVDTFNEAIKAGTCITHLVDASIFGNSGTTSVMCNVRQSFSSVVWIPAQGGLPAASKPPTTTASAGNWVTPAGAWDVGGAAATLPFTTSTVTRAATSPATAAGWSGLSSIGTTADGASASVLVGNGKSASLNAGTATATGTWTNAGSATGAANATIATTTVAATAVGAFNGAGAASAVGLWTTPNNADGAANMAYASSTVLRNNGAAALWSSGSAVGAALPDAAQLISMSVTVRWHAANTSVRGRVELWDSGTQLTTPATVALPTTDGNATFNFTAADLATVTGADVKAAQFFRVHVVNTSNTADYSAQIDSITVTSTYSTRSVLRLTNFGLNVPSTATITSVTVTPRVGSTAAAGVAGTVLATVYKTLGATAVASTAVTLTGNTVLANTPVVLPTLLAADLTDANFAVDLAVTPGSTASFTANVDSVNVAVAYTMADTQTLALTGFDFSAIPAGAAIETVKTTVGFGIGALNNKASMTAVTKVGTTTLTTISNANLATTIQQSTSTYSNAAGTVTQASLSGLQVDLTGTTTMNGFTGLVDNVAVEVKYLPYKVSAIELAGFGFAVPVGSTDVSVTFQANWSSTLGSTKLCLEAYDGATLIGAPVCSTAGAAPATLTAATSAGTNATVANVNNLSLRVTATHADGAADSTATLDYVAAQVKYTTPPTLTGVDECNTYNNWTVSKASPPLYCPAVTTYYDFNTTRVFDGVCPPGTRTRWRLFGWDSSTPNSTKVEFRFRSFDPTDVAGVSTCVELPAVSSDPPSSLATAQSTPTDTQICSLTAPPTATCPANLTTYLGNDPTSDLRCLQMDAHGYADTLGAPTLNGWTATYDCLPSE